MNNKLFLLFLTIILIFGCKKENHHNSAAPVASFTDTVIGREPVVVFFETLPTGKPDASYKWDFGNGIISTVMNPVVSYDKFGTYWVVLVQTSTSGVSDTAKRLIDINTSGAHTTDSSVNKIDFKYSMNSAAPYTVKLVNTSTNGNSYFGDFGDGTNLSSPSDTLSHEYKLAEYIKFY